MFLHIFVAKGDIGQSFWEIIAYEQYNFHQQRSKFFGGHGFNVLIEKCTLEEWEQIHQFSRQSKGLESNAVAISFPEICYKSIFSSSFSWFMKLMVVIYMESMFPCYSLPDMKVIAVYHLLSINPWKFMSGYLFFPNNVPSRQLYVQS